MSGLVEGAAVGVAFDLLVKAVLDVTVRVATFNSVLVPLKLTLAGIHPIVHDIHKLNKELDSRHETSESLVNLLKEGEALVRKCLKANKWWNPCKKYYYSRKIDDFKEDLLWFFQINVQAEISRDGKLTSSRVCSIEEKLDRVLSILLKDGSSSRSSRFSGWCDVPKLPQFLVGMDLPVQEVKAMLLTGQDTVVVVSAPGGCGKTTLVSKLCADEEIKGRFKNKILFVTVSEKPDLQGIVKKIFEKMNNHQVPNFRNDEDSIDQLKYLLGKIGSYPVLLVLDDVWSGSEWLIDKLNFGKAEYKILVTSRFIFPEFESTYKLKPLNDGDAMTLFFHSAFKDGNINVRKEIVEKVVGACGGFPLALNVVGRSLYKQHEATWITRVRKLREGHSIFDTNIKLLECLATSLDALDETDTLKECFLDLGLFPDDQKIPAEVLKDIWKELYDLDEDGIYTLAYLEDLSNRNLLDLTLARKDASDVVIDYCHQHFVTQHDLLRELAIYRNSRDPAVKRGKLILDIKEGAFPKWWIDKEMQHSEARVLSITTDEMFSSNWQDAHLPRLEVLILNIWSSGYTLPKFVEGMSRLSVLIITNYGSFPFLELTGAEVFACLLNLKRLRLEHVKISTFSSMLQLRNLQKLSLIMCKIGKAFQTTRVETNDIWPNLTEINIDCCYELAELPAWLCHLLQLRKLSISYCGELASLPRELGNLTNLEVLRINSCTLLEELPDSICKLQRLRFLDLSYLLLDHMPVKLGDLWALRTIRMIGCKGLYELPRSVVDLKQLENVVCDEEASNLWRSYGFEDLIRIVKADTTWSWHLIVPAKN